LAAAAAAANAPAAERLTPVRNTLTRMRLSATPLPPASPHLPPFRRAPSDYSAFGAYYYWILLASQVWAICCLVLFFEATLTFMWPLKPFLKFLSVKGLVFVAWIQGLIITDLLVAGYVSSYREMSAVEVAEALQNFVVCIEMLILASMHHVAFGAHEFWHPMRGALGNLSPEEAASPRVKLTAVAVAVELLPVADMNMDAAVAARALLPGPRSAEAGAGKDGGASEPAVASASCIPSAAPRAAAPQPPTSARKSRVVPAPAPTAAE